MGIRTAWTALWSPSQKASEAGALIAMSQVGRAVWTPRNYEAFAREAYEQNVIAYRSINEVSTAAASVPWKLFRTASDGKEREEIKEHPLLKILRQPNPQQGGSEFCEAVLGYFQLAGNSYIEAAGPDAGPPLELWTLRPDRMKVVPGETGLPAAYVYTVNSETKKWEIDPLTGQGAILQLKRFHPTNDWYGMSAVEPVARSVDQRNESDRWNLALLQNETRPSGAFVYEPKDSGAVLTDSQFQRLKDQLAEQHQGAENAGRPFVLEGGMKWMPMSITPKDMDWLDGKHSSSRDIALGFGVPPQLLGIPGDSTFSNYREARLALWEETVIPLLRHIRDEYNNWLVPQFAKGQQDGRLELDVDLDEVSALTLRRERKFDMAEGASFLTINEKRVALGFGEIDGGDVLLVPANMLPLTGEDVDDDEGEPDDDEARSLRELTYGKHHRPTKPPRSPPGVDGAIPIKKRIPA